MSYILITPVKNEEKNLPKLVNCIINQTIIPEIWIILNDNSTDKTPIIIKDLETNFSWIKGVTLSDVRNRDLDEHFGKICNYAFEEAINYCKEFKVHINYLAKVDADIILPKNCMEEILNRLNKNNNIGIVSPNILDLPDSLINKTLLNPTENLINKYSRLDMLEPSDGLRFYRYDTYNDIGGIPITMAPDAVALVKAKLRGWKIERVKNIICYKTRKTSTSIHSTFHGYFLQGLRRYYLNYPLSIVTLDAILELFKGRPDLCFAILFGFIDAAINKKEKIIDYELRNYFHKERPKEIINLLLRGEP